MSSPTRRHSFVRVIVDLNTQCDLFLPRGRLPVVNRQEALPCIRKLMNWARIEKTPIVSSLESHRPGECLKGLPPYCLDGTSGQRKIPFTLMPRRIVCVGDNTCDLPVDLFRRTQQLIFTKRTRDFLSNPKAERLLYAVETHHYVVFGAVAEHCVKAAALGLLARQNRVAVVTDASGFWSASDAELAFRQMEAKGAVLVTTDELMAGAADERIHASRPVVMVDEDSEEEAVAGANGNGANGKHGANGKRGGNGRPLHEHPTPARLTDPHRPAGAERLRPDIPLRKHHGGHSVKPPPGGFA